MKYMGSKNRVAKEILPIILKNRKKDQWYVEPFVGGGNLIDKVQGNRIGSDLHIDAIQALKLIRDHVDLIPKDSSEFSEEDYKKIKREPDHYLHGYCGFSLSYGGKWFGGWRRDSQGKRDYVAEAYRNAVKQSKLIKDIVFESLSYSSLYLPPNSIIYCDPPYAKTTGYKDSFKHKDFWEWCRKKYVEGHDVFISEYSAPSDFVCMWEKEIVSSLTRNTGSKKGIEKLFMK